jgi:hypothetical protein
MQADESCDLDFLKPGTDDEFSFIEPVAGRSYILNNVPKRMKR